MRAVDVLLAAKSITEEYKTRKENIKLPINLIGDGIKEIVEAQSSQKVNITCLEWPGDLFIARLDRYEKHSNIWYSDSLNRCWSRFIIAKELIHVAVGNEENFTKDVPELISAIINDVPLTEEMKDYQIEKLAYFGAVELLIPTFFYDVLYEMEKTGMTHREIAHKFVIPESVITARLGGARKTFDSFKKDVA